MSHYKINERKCSTTFFPFDFIFLCNTDGGDGDGSRGISVSEASRNHSQFTLPSPGVELYLPPLGPGPPLTSDFLLPGAACRSLAKDWQ